MSVRGCAWRWRGGAGASARSRAFVCSSACRGRRSWSAGWRRGVLTRSGSTWRRSATRSWATTRTAGAASRARPTRPWVIRSPGSRASPCTRRAWASPIRRRERGSNWRPLFPTGSRGSWLIFAADPGDVRGALAPCYHFSGMSELTAVILAAGDSTRMRSRRPKVLHPLCGRRLIDYPINAARALGARLVVVVGRNADLVGEAVKAVSDATCVEQKERLGTGHAVLQARAACGGDSDAILVLPGDMPLLSEATLRRLVEHRRGGGAPVALLTAQLPEPTGDGRVARGNGTA